MRRGTAASGAAAEMFAHARRHLQNGQLAAADELCRKILAVDPQHAGSLHILGSIALHVGRPDVAVDWLGRAIGANAHDAALQNEMGLALQALGRLDDAVAHFRRATSLEPHNGRAYNNLAIALWQQGRAGEAAAQFAKALELTSELFDEYGAVCGTLFNLNPAIGTAAMRAMSAWPRRASMEELFGPDGYRAAAGDPLLHCMLVCSPVRGVELERLLICVRSALLESVVRGRYAAADADDLKFRCALARQCFINEFVFAATAEETAAAERLRQSLISALEARSPLAPETIAAAACYFALHEIPGAGALLDRTAYAGWPAAVDALLTVQLREPLLERELRASIPALTAIENETSLAVRQQYEENPYPRWILPPAQSEKVPLHAFLKKHWPHAPLHGVPEGDSLDVLVAGCGTGRLPVAIAQTFAGARILAVDLSLASLAYAQRKSRELGCDIAYAQADILKLGSIGRSFDFIEVGGVLHHMADPEAGWRVLVSLLRPGGVMRVALYSELARRDIVAARAVCAERGLRPTAEDIRAARELLLAGEMRQKLARISDFYTTSECRDLLFHVQEQRFTIARIRAFLAEQSLNFIGFHIPPPLVAAYGRRFPYDRGLRDLDNWEKFEREQPDTFLSMYQFWVQKPASST
ncbi:MAG TPA: methyltransferase domain-containing protein [Xanthobacteraceae bacterium]|nr:methyltransferase domain-containing protein [Xanthobacteraceae bacterium]